MSTASQRLEWRGTLTSLDMSKMIPVDLRFNINGRAYREQIVGETGEMRWPLAAGQARWCNAELRDADDGLWAVTNPIYFGQA